MLRADRSGTDRRPDVAGLRVNLGVLRPLLLSYGPDDLPSERPHRLGQIGRSAFMVLELEQVTRIRAVI